MKDTEAWRTLAEQLANKATYTAAGAVAAVGAWSVHEWAVAVGMGIAALTYLTTLIFQLRRDRRDRERMDIQRREHEQHEQAHDEAREPE